MISQPLSKKCTVVNRGINHWEEFKDVFDVDRLHYEEIDTTYRSTYEIMTYANLVLQTPVLRQLNYQLAEPFARHGPDVRTYEVSDIDEILLRILDEIEEIKSKGLSTVAIIGKDFEEGALINDFLHNHGYQVDYIIDSDSVYGSEIAIIPSFLAKGLEFDACIIADASDEKYPSDPLHGRLLYVSITRALHELVVIWRGVPSPHLPE
jgi:DNA helicase II / ATP-dependent DNA helicase PcrA